MLLLYGTICKSILVVIGVCIIYQVQTAKCQSTPASDNKTKHTLYELYDRVGNNESEYLVQTTATTNSPIYETTTIENELPTLENTNDTESSMPTKPTPDAEPPIERNTAFDDLDNESLHLYSRLINILNKTKKLTQSLKKISTLSHSLSIGRVDDEYKPRNDPLTEFGAEDVQREDDVLNTIATRMFDEAFQKSEKCTNAIDCKFAASKRTGMKLSISTNNLRSQGFDSSSKYDTYKTSITEVLGKMSPINSFRVRYGLAIERNFDKIFRSKGFSELFSPKSSYAVMGSPVQEKDTDNGGDKSVEAVLESTNFISNSVGDSIRQKRNPQSFNFPSFLPDIFPTTTQKSSEFDFPIKFPEIKLPFDMPIGRRKRQVQNFSPFDLIANLGMIKDVSDSQNSIPPTSSDVLNLDVLQSETSKEKCPQKMLLLLKDLVLIYVKSNFDSEEIEKILDSLRSELLNDHYKSAYPSSFLFFKDLMTDRRSITCIQYLISEFCKNNNLCTSSKQMKQLRNDINKQISTYLSHPYNEIKTNVYSNGYHKENVEDESVNNNQITLEELSADLENKLSISNYTKSNLHDNDLETNKTSSYPIYDSGNDYLNNLQSIDKQEGSPLVFDEQLLELKIDLGSKLIKNLENAMNDLVNSSDDQYQDENLQFEEGGLDSDNLEHLKCTCKFSELGSDSEQNDKIDQSILNDVQPEGDQNFSVFRYSNEEHQSGISPVVNHNGVYEGLGKSEDSDVEVEGEILVQTEFFKEKHQKFIINNQKGLGVDREVELAKNDLPSSILQNIQLHFNSHKPGIAKSDSNWQALEKRSRQIRSPYRTFYYRIPRMRRMRYQNREKENLEDLENSDKNDAQMADEGKDVEDKEVENIPDTSSASTTTTTSTTTTESSTTTEDEFSSYDEDEEEACNKDILDIIFTTIKCFFNMITSAIIGIEFGANCCHQ